MEVILVKFSLGQNMKEKETVLSSFTIVERFTIELPKNYTMFIHEKYIFILQYKIVRTLMNSTLFRYLQPRKDKLSWTSDHNCSLVWLVGYFKLHTAQCFSKSSLSSELLVLLPLSESSALSIIFFLILAKFQTSSLLLFKSFSGVR